MTSVAGCDSIATLNLTINDVLTSLEDVTICSNQLPYNWNGVDFTAAGSPLDVTLTNVAGCDSIATLNLSINEVLTSTEDVTLCSNQLPPLGMVLTTLRVSYDITLTSVAGCDSVATVN
ncbi:MAG: hypothetical protein R2809_02875 [Flavobacteriales bacterium]